MQYRSLPSVKLLLTPLFVNVIAHGKIGGTLTQDCTNEHIMRRRDKTKVDSGTLAGNHVPVCVFRSIFKARPMSSSKEERRKEKDYDQDLILAVRNGALIVIH
jgi:hypothetical protein